MQILGSSQFARRPGLSLDFLQSASRRLSLTSGLPALPLPITISVWAYPTDNAVVSSLCYFANTSDTTSQIGLDIVGTVANDPFRVWGGNSASSINSPPFNQWSNFAGVFASTTSRTAYLNGIAGTADTGSGSTNLLNTRFDIGALFRSDFGSGVNFMSGRIASVAVWADELLPAEMKMLAAGVNPRRIRPQTLRFLWEFDGQMNVANKAPMFRAPAPLVAANSPNAAPGPVYERPTARIWVPLSAVASSDVTVAITGQAVAATAGALAPSATVAASGQAATASAGTLIATAAVALSGQAAAASAGTMSPSRAVAASGQAVTASAGTLAPSANVPLSGQAATASAGTVTYAADGNVTVSLTGQAVTASAGTLAVLRSTALSGAAMAASAGTAVPGIGIAASGSQVTTAAGTLALGIAVPLSGAAAAAAAGTLTYSAAGNVTVALTGTAVTAHAGTLVFELEGPLVNSAPPLGGRLETDTRAARLSGTRVARTQSRTR